MWIPIYARGFCFLTSILPPEAGQLMGLRTFKAYQCQEDNWEWSIHRILILFCSRLFKVTNVHLPCMQTKSNGHLCLIIVRTCCFYWAVQPMTIKSSWHTLYLSRQSKRWRVVFDAVLDPNFLSYRGQATKGVLWVWEKGAIISIAWSFDFFHRGLLHWLVRSLTKRKMQYWGFKFSKLFG